MTRDKRLVQLTLIFIGIFLILATYFLYPSISKKQVEKKRVDEELTVTTDENQSSKFEKIEYEGLYNIDTPFTVKSEKAHILTNEPDVVYMDNMHVSLFLSDGRIVNITSDRGRYNKVTYDCFFEDNVKSSDGETIILSKNMDLLASNDTAKVYNDVFLTNDEGTLSADKVDYDFKTKFYQISMFGSDKVKIKIIQ